MDSVTRRDTPRAEPTDWRRVVTSVKKAVALAPVMESGLAASMITSTPSRAEARPPFVRRSTPRDRLSTTASWPAPATASTTYFPTMPVPPATAILMAISPSLGYLHWTTRPSPPSPLQVLAQAPQGPSPGSLQDRPPLGSWRVVWSAPSRLSACSEREGLSHAPSSLVHERISSGKEGDQPVLWVPTGGAPWREVAGKTET